MPLVFLVGGARSGKSAIALDLLARTGQPAVFVATAEARDEEMRDRIALHRAERPSVWRTVEAPRSLLGALEEIDDEAPIIVDCLTLWVANLLEAGLDEEPILNEAAAIASLLAAREPPSIVISNEVGAGIVPMEQLSRRYRDLLGRVNVCVGRAADKTYYVAAGRVLPLSAASSIALARRR